MRDSEPIRLLKSPRSLSVYILKGFSPGMALNSYLNDYVEGKQFYFSFGSFPTERSLNLGLRSRFNF